MKSEGNSARPVQAAVLGYGLGGRVFHCPFISAVPGLELATILQRHGDTASAAYPTAKIARTFDEILNDSDIELVVVTTPNETHFELAKQALLAGKHCVVDKPLAATSEEAETLLQLSRQTGRLLIPFHNRRFDGDFFTVQQLVEQEALGRIVEISSRFDRFRPAPRINSWKEADGAMSGILFDLGPHLIDQALALFGAPSSIDARVYRDRDGSTVVDAFELTMEYGDRGMRYHCGSSLLAAAPEPRYRINGTRGSYVKYGVDPQEPRIVAGNLPPQLGSGEKWLHEPEEAWGTLTTEHSTEPGKLVSERYPTLPGDYRLFYQNVLAALRHGEKLAVTAADGFRSIRMIELAMQSNAEKRSITVDLRY